MLTLIEGQRQVVLHRVYRHTDPKFAECKFWIVVFSKDSYEIFGLGFDPFDLMKEIAREDPDHPYVWPTNEMFHNVAGHLCRGEHQHWKIVETK